MLGDDRRHHRQILDLVTRRITCRHALMLAKEMSTPALAGPVIDVIVDPPRRQQRAALALMTRLSTLLAPRRILAPRWRAARRILARRQRRVTRGPLGLALKLRDALLLTSNARRQHLDLRDQPRVLGRELQQHRNDRPTAPLIDRLRLDPLHTPKFDAPQLCPPNPLNAYRKAPIYGAFRVDSGGGIRTRDLRVMRAGSRSVAIRPSCDY